VPIAIHPAFRAVQSPFGSAFEDGPSPPAPGERHGRRWRASCLHDLTSTSPPSTLPHPEGWSYSNPAPAGSLLARSLGRMSPRGPSRRPRATCATSRVTSFRRQCWISADPDEHTIPALAAVYGSDRFFWARLSASRPHRRLSAGAGTHGGGHAERCARAAARRNVRAAYRI